MIAFSTGLSALSVNQRLLDLTGQNIANANTPGYHRQLADLAARVFDNVQGGVEIKQIRRLTSNVIEAALTRNTSETSSLQTELTGLRQLQSLLTPGDGSVHDLMEQLFNQFEELGSRPDDLVQRNLVVTTASNLAHGLTNLAGSFKQLDQQLDTQAAQLVQQINTLAPQIADLNGSIARLTVQGIPANDLLDRRDALVSQLSQLVDVRTVEQDHGMIVVMAANVPIVSGPQTLPLQYVSGSTSATGHASVVLAGMPTVPLSVTGGELAGNLKLQQDVLPELQAQLQNLTEQLVVRLDELQATGLGLNGPTSLVTGDRAVNDTSVPLAQAGLAFPIQAGSLVLTVTDLNTGQRTNHEITVDPSGQSLQDLGAAISSIPNIQGVVDEQTKTLHLLTSPGYAIDFAGRLPTSPDTVAITGTATAQVGGVYTGDANDSYTFQVVGSGEIGVTPGLHLEVHHGGDLIETRNIGAGYEPGSPLEPIQGIQIQLSAGTINNGDTFTVRAIARPDTSGLLPALGINSFFRWNGVGDFDVRDNLLTNPEQLAAAQTGQPGDGSNAQQMATLRDLRLFAGGTQTFAEFQQATIANVGLRVQTAAQQQTAHETLGESLNAQQQAVSGVDPNEELVRLMQFQRAFQLSARYLTVVNETLDDLVGLIR